MYVSFFQLFRMTKKIQMYFFNKINGTSNTPVLKKILKDFLLVSLNYFPRKNVVESFKILFNIISYGMKK